MKLIYYYDLLKNKSFFKSFKSIVDLSQTEVSEADWEYASWYYLLTTTEYTIAALKEGSALYFFQKIDQFRIIETIIDIEQDEETEEILLKIKLPSSSSEILLNNEPTPQDTIKLLSKEANILYPESVYTTPLYEIVEENEVSQKLKLINTLEGTTLRVFLDTQKQKRYLVLPYKKTKQVLLEVQKKKENIELLLEDVNANLETFSIKSIKDLLNEETFNKLMTRIQKLDEKHKLETARYNPRYEHLNFNKVADKKSLLISARPPNINTESLRPKLHTDLSQYKN